MIRFLLISKMLISSDISFSTQTMYHYLKENDNFIIFSLHKAWIYKSLAGCIVPLKNRT